MDVDISQLYECRTVKETHQLHLVKPLYNDIFETWTRNLSYFGASCSNNECKDCESTKWVGSWDHVSLPIGQCIWLQLSQLEEDQPTI